MVLLSYRYYMSKPAHDIVEKPAEVTAKDSSYIKNKSTKQERKTRALQSMPHTNHRAHLLIVEDEPVSRMRCASYFEAEGFKVTQTEDGASMRRALDANDFDLILLDINLPDEDGLVLAKEIRAISEIGIILVTGRTSDIDRIVGLEVGADDYVTKPVNMRELFVRVKNLLRRTSGGHKPDRSSHNDKKDIRYFTGWSFDLQKRQLENTSQQRMKLTRGEFELLNLLTSHPGTVLNRERIMNFVRHREWNPSDRSVDVLVRKLRQKIEADPANPELIITVHGEGYLFAADVN